MGMLEFVTVASVVVAVAMSVVAWRVVQNERMRSAARVAALAAEIHETDSSGDLPLRAGAARTASTPMFTTVSAQPQRSRMLLPAAIVLIGCAIGAALVVLGPLAPETSAPAASRAQSGRTLPLELIALGHERDADGLVVRGVLRNPSNGVEVDALTAVVMLFNHDGGLVGSGRAAVEAAKLLPGGETAFVVTVPGAGNVERYRVSFRNNDRVVPHVDQRS